MGALYRTLRCKWTRRAILALALCAVLFTGYLVWERYSTMAEGEKNRDELIARLDANEAGWKWEDIDSARGPVPSFDSEDGQVARLAALFKAHTKTDRSLRIDAKRPGAINVRRTNTDRQDLERVASSQSELLQIALGFRSGPDSVRRVQLASDVFSTERQDTVAIAHACDLLDDDAERCCDDGDIASALDRTRAILNAERSIGNEPFGTSQLTRMRAAVQAAGLVERALAMGESKPDFADLQAMLLAEAKVDFALTACRGERATMHHLYSGLSAGSVPFRPFVETRLDMKGRVDAKEEWILLESFAFGAWEYQKYVPQSHAETLKWLTFACEACQQPEEFLTNAVRQVYLKQPISSDEGRLCKLLVVSPDSYIKEQLRTRARLRCAATALAVERFRLMKGDWPESLLDIPRGILPENPLDPITGEPLRYERVPDGVLISTSTYDSVLKRKWQPDEPEVEDVFRLFDVAQRRQPSSVPTP